MTTCGVCGIVSAGLSAGGSGFFWPSAWSGWFGVVACCGVDSGTVGGGSSLLVVVDVAPSSASVQFFVVSSGSCCFVPGLGLDVCCFFWLPVVWRQTSPSVILHIQPRYFSTQVYVP
uniref:Putative secreted protein n=1 Tax=Ixodes ricinus TaxID=34613 RepID=A0A6B0ULD0_IXORI